MTALWQVKLRKQQAQLSLNAMGNLIRAFSQLRRHRKKSWSILVNFAKIDFSKYGD